MTDPLDNVLDDMKAAYRRMFADAGERADAAAAMSDHPDRIRIVIPEDRVLTRVVPERNEIRATVVAPGVASMLPVDDPSDLEESPEYLENGASTSCGEWAVVAAMGLAAIAAVATVATAFHRFRR